MVNKVCYCSVQGTLTAGKILLLQCVQGTLTVEQGMLLQCSSDTYYWIKSVTVVC
jgi:hypothetical protein